MSLIDDLKQVMTNLSIPESKREQVIKEITNKYGGSKWYVRKRELGLTFKNHIAHH